jgi:hypothetical protein
MQRRYELIDMVAVVGLCATIAAAGLLFMASNGMVSISLTGHPVIEPLTGKMDGMRWLQPILGQAIVDQDLLDRRHAAIAPAAVAQLTGVSGEYRRWQNSPFGYLDSIKTSALWAEADHATRVQTVMGRAIVQFTGRGVRSGLLSSERTIANHNSLMIDRTDALGHRMDANFLANWQPNLGRAIVAASQDNAKLSALTQERLGSAIVQLTAIQSVYGSVYGAAHAVIQEQLGGATVVATRTESQMSGTSLDRSAQGPVGTVAAPRSWPVFPMTTIVVASLILMSLFSAGLLVSPRLPEVHLDELAQISPTALVAHEAV